MSLRSSVPDLAPQFCDGCRGPTRKWLPEVRDRDGDAFRLEWRGCTSGTGVTERCSIDRPGEHTAQNSACPHARVTAGGPCRVSFAVCGGVGDVFDFDIRTLDGPGTCVVEATVTDPWGAVGRDTLAFRVTAP